MANRYGIKAVMSLWSLTAVLLFSLGAGATPAHGSKENERMALLIGNSAYSGKDKLDNPVNDVNDYGEALRQAGFTVEVRTNLKRQELAAAVRDFGKRVEKQKGIALFHYAGHGVAVDDLNYMVPIGAVTDQGDNQLVTDSLSVDHMVKALGTNPGRINVVILDMCRSLPGRGIRGEAGGLAPMKPPEGGTLLAFSTRYGMPAGDGSGQRNSPYAQQLITALSQRDLTVTDYFNVVRFGVRTTTGGKQVPVEESTLEGKVPLLIAGGDPQPQRQQPDNGFQQDSGIFVAPSKIQAQPAGATLPPTQTQSQFSIPSSYSPVSSTVSINAREAKYSKLPDNNDRYINAIEESVKSKTAVLDEVLTKKNNALLEHILNILMRDTKSMDNEEREYWKRTSPQMTFEQRFKLLEVLATERQKLAALDRERSSEIRRLNEKYSKE